MKRLAAGLTFSASTLCLANDKPLYFWDEEIRLFGAASPGQHVGAFLANRRNIAYQPTGLELDHADRVEGDLSILYTPSISSLRAMPVAGGLFDNRQENGQNWASAFVGAYFAFPFFGREGQLYRELARSFSHHWDIRSA